MARLASTPWSVFDVLSDSIRAIDEGRCVREAMCVGLARVLRASVAAFVQCDSLSQQCTVVCWAELQDWEALRYTTCESWSLLSCRTDSHAQWRQSAAYIVIRNLTGPSDFLEARLACDPDGHRLAVFGRSERFRPGEVNLVAACEDSLAALDGHARHIETDFMGASDEASRPHIRSDDHLGGWGLGQEIGLTKRELDVLTLLAQGLKVRSMARRLGVSPRTVHKHLGNAYQKLGVHDRVVAVRNAQSLGILPMPEVAHSSPVGSAQGVRSAYSAP